METVEENGIIKINSDAFGQIEADFFCRPLSWDSGNSLFLRSFDNVWYELNAARNLVYRIPEAEEIFKINSKFYEALESNSKSRLKSLGLDSEDKFSNFLKEDAKKYTKLYGENPIFPPMLSSPIYLPVSTGSEWNYCNVFGEYKGITHNIRSFEEFSKELELVKSYFGDSFPSRKSVYLGDARAIDIDQKELTSIMDLIRSELGLPVASSFDIYSTPKKRNMISYRDLKEHGLSRMYVYVESGSYKVIRLLNRNINITEAMNDISNIKDHEIPVSIVIMAGTGGLKLSKDHVASTANLISQLPLGLNDQIFICPVIQESDQTYYKMLETENLGIMSMEQILSQMQDLRNNILSSFSDVNGSELKTKIIDWDLRIPPH